MNILSDFGKDEQVKKVAQKTGISGKNSALQVIIVLVPFVILIIIIIIIIIISSFFFLFEGEMFGIQTGSFCHTWHDRVSK